MKKNFVAIGIIITFMVTLGGVYSLVRKHSLRELETNALEELDGGNYSAALVMYSTLRDKLSGDLTIGTKVEDIKRLFVAEDNFLKAQQAAENGEWFDVRALLRESDAVSNPTFKYYEEASELYQQAEDEIRVIEGEAATKIVRLQQKTVSEELKRRQVETQLQATIVEKQQAEKILEFTKRLVVESQKQVEVITRIAERERFEKFLNELSLYVDMFDKGDGYLNFALVEIDRGRDITALTFITQGRVLFTEIKSMVEEMRSNRTLGQYNGQVNTMIEALSYMVDASKNLGTSILYIQEKTGSGFLQFFNKGGELKSKANIILGDIKRFINSNK